MNGGPRGFTAEVSRFIRGNLSSTVASTVEYVLVTGLVLLRVHYLHATTAGAITGAVTDFSLKRHWAFQRKEKGPVHHEGARYLAAATGSLVLNLALSYLLVDGLGVPAVPGVIGASLVIGFAWNYPMHRWYVFGRSPASGAGLAPGPESTHRRRSGAAARGAAGGEP